jgi:broad-specificity NMP kinase
MSEVKYIWNVVGGNYFQASSSTEHEYLPNTIFTVEQDQFDRFFLSPKRDAFTFNHKIYGLETKLIERVVKTYTHTSGNLGILMVGMKGSGKTVTSKIICQRLGLPVILVNKNMDGVGEFLNSISQEVIVFIDEYEKIFEESHALLPIMDGSMNSAYRRVFVLTTNTLDIDRNLTERPSRIRYTVEFGNLKAEMVEEIVDDMLINKDRKNSCIEFFKRMSIVTIDIVKTVLEEVNIHDEDPTDYFDFMNVYENNCLYDVFLMDEDDNQRLIAKSVKVSREPEYCDDDEYLSFKINGKYIGEICRVNNSNSVTLKTPSNSHINIFVQKSETAINSVFAYASTGVKPVGGGEFESFIKELNYHGTNQD